MRSKIAIDPRDHPATGDAPGGRTRRDAGYGEGGRFLPFLFATGNRRRPDRQPLRHLPHPEQPVPPTPQQPQVDQRRLGGRRRPTPRHNPRLFGSPGSPGGLGSRSGSKIPSIPCYRLGRLDSAALPTCNRYALFCKGSGPSLRWCPSAFGTERSKVRIFSPRQV